MGDVKHVGNLSQHRPKTQDVFPRDAGDKRAYVGFPVSGIHKKHYRSAVVLGSPKKLASFLRGEAIGKSRFATGISLPGSRLLFSSAVEHTVRAGKSRSTNGK